MKKRTQRALSLLCSVAMLWACGVLTPPVRAVEVNPADGTATFVIWTKINKGKSLKEQISGEKAQPLLLSYDPTTAATNGMFNSAYYVKSSNIYLTCATRDNYIYTANDFRLDGMPMLSSRQFDDMRDYWKSGEPFITQGTYNCLWGRYQERDGYGAVVFNLSDGQDGPGEFLGAGGDYYGTYEGHTVHDTSFVIRDTETKPFGFMFSGYNDTGFLLWHDDPNGENEHCYFTGSAFRLRDEYHHTFYTAHAGTAITASAITHDFTVLNDQATTVGRPLSYIPPGVTLRVANGGVLTVNGMLFNDGKIVVEEGGLLVLRRDALVTPWDAEGAGGGISSAGTIVLEHNAKLIGGGSNGIYITNGLVYNYGLMMSENFTVKKPNLIENQDSGEVIAGKSYNKTSRNTAMILAYRVNNSEIESPSVRVISETMLGYNRSSVTVNLAEGAVYGNAAGLRNYGSVSYTGKGNATYQEEGGELVTVYTADSDGDWSDALTVKRNELGYYQSNTGTKVTRREVMEMDGSMTRLRTSYWPIYQRETGAVIPNAAYDKALEQYLENYFAEQGIDLDETVVVRDGIFTVNGIPALTIPWNQTFAVANQDGTYLIDKTTPIRFGSGFGQGVTYEFSSASDVINGARITFKNSGNRSPAMVIMNESNEDTRWKLGEAARETVNGAERIYYTIRSVSTGMELALESNTVDIGVRVIVEEPNGSNAHQWYFEPAGDGNYHIVSRVTDSAGKSYSIQALPNYAVDVWEKKDTSKSQLWKLHMPF